MRSLMLPALLMLAASSLVAQQTETQTLPATTPLAITVQPSPATKASSLRFVTVTLTNTSDRTVRLPLPAIGCENAAEGYVRVVVLQGNAAELQPCSQHTPLPEVGKWVALKPGETANFGQMVNPLLPSGPALLSCAQATRLPP